MRILYDGQIFAQQSAGGINRYFANVIVRLPPDVTPVVTAPRRHPMHFPAHSNLQLHLHQPPDWTKHLRPLRRFWQRRHFQQFYRSVSADVLHPTYYSLLSGAEFRGHRWPVVLTVHDMIHERFARELDPRGEEAEIKRRAIAQAQAIICISEHTKADLLEICRPPEWKISVIPQAADLDLGPPGVPVSVPRRPYFLYVGSRAAHKNFGRLLEALVPVIGKHPDVTLQVVGPPFKRREITRLGELRLEQHVVHCGQITDAQLVALYRGSLAFVYPSLYEGFGIPPLEAMLCGTAVVAADSSSIPEVVGDAGLLFDPLSTEALTDSLLTLVTSPGLRQRLIERGFGRAKQFDWERTAQRTLAVYRSVAGARTQQAA